MSRVPQPTDRPEAPLFADGLGERVVAADGATGELLQILRIRPALTAVPSFEFALRERAARLANFRHAYYARVRRIDRTQQASGLAIVSDHVEGTRLSDILRVAHEKRLQLDINAAICLIRQLVPAVAMLHENARDAAHGLIAPERIVVTPHTRLVIVEHVLAAAVEQLQFGRERLWQEFRIAMPPSAGVPRFDHRADVTGVGLVALALVLGRPIAANEFPHAIPTLLHEARERSPLGDEQPLSPALRAWLARALQVDTRRAFASAPEAMAALDEVVADDSVYVAAPVALESFLSRYIASLLEPVATETASPAPVVQGKVAAHPAAKAAAPPPAAASPAAPASAASTAKDISDLIPARELEALAGTTPKPLFNPDAPFSVKSEPLPPARKSRGRRPSIVRIAALLGAILALGGGGLFASKYFMHDPVAVEGGGVTTGTLIVQSNPAGVQVFVDGIERGMTPARLSVPPGAHILELRGRGVPRVIPLQVPAGAQISQYLEFAETPTTGRLQVQSEPAGAKVTIDGTPRGVAPVTVSDLTPGDHEVILQNDTGTARHVVTIQAGVTSSLLAPMGLSAANGPVSGWVAVKAPFALEIREQGRLLGTTDTDRIMMAAGRHDLELVNESLGYRATRSVQVPPGKVALVTLDLPNGVVNLNASPWAEVWIDGQRVGETPIGNLGVPIGPHEVVFRHPQFGEKRHAISVTLGGPVRLSVDMK
jgi:serine/threonine protein kinase